MDYLDRTTLEARRETLQRQLRDSYKTLNRLEEQEAQYGLRVPVDLLNELDAVRGRIARVEEELDRVAARLESLPLEDSTATGDPAVETGPAPVEAETGYAPASIDGLSAQALTPLVEALARRSLALFIGPDLPAAVTGLPARADLAREFARREGLDPALSLAEVTQRISQAGNRWEFTNFLRNALDTAGKSPRPFHQAAAALLKAHRLETVITTAYDPLLEQACQQGGLAYNRLVRGADANFLDPDRPTLIKLYGDLQQPDTLVVTDQDHSALLRDRDREEVVDEVKRTFRRNTILFLGYNLADSDFRFLFDQVAESHFARTAYAAWPGLAPEDVRMWRDRGIVILAADPVTVLNGLLAAPAEGS